MDHDRVILVPDHSARPSPAARRSDLDFLSRRYRALADRIGDELDKLPNPSAFRAGVESERARHAEAMAG